MIVCKKQAKNSKQAGYDFGDEWLHQIEVEAIEDYSGNGKYPKITKKVGKSPPQYIYENGE